MRKEEDPLVLFSAIINEDQKERQKVRPLRAALRAQPERVLVGQGDTPGFPVLCWEHPAGSRNSCSRLKI